MSPQCMTLVATDEELSKRNEPSISPLDRPLADPERQVYRDDSPQVYQAVIHSRAAPLAIRRV